MLCLLCFLFGNWFRVEVVELLFGVDFVMMVVVYFDDYGVFYYCFMELYMNYFEVCDCVDGFVICVVL